MKVHTSPRRMRQMESVTCSLQIRRGISSLPSIISSKMGGFLRIGSTAKLVFYVFYYNVSSTSLSFFRTPLTRLSCTSMRRQAMQRALGWLGRPGACYSFYRRLTVLARGRLARFWVSQSHLRRFIEVPIDGTGIQEHALALPLSCVHSPIGGYFLVFRSTLQK
ncbi:hypothetical protein SCHPADRAFT_526524 [Schizopora paradoxa]|uniref:Uncharacterized protein n=1 Tax=Schizopora paradoxa TaxID=27342 RepID=A0A0H2RZQ4_9AGAM|nr:hypothetical protein SCHPADRAFT_526524 [Schizopora paradoxa]